LSPVRPRIGKQEPYELDLVRTEQAVGERLKERIEREGITIFGGETPSGRAGS
jgi:hypothetical protein